MYNESRDQRQQFAQILREFSESTRKIYDNYAYSAGYLETLASQMLCDLPRAKQQQYIAEMQRALSTHQRQAEAQAVELQTRRG